MTDLDGLRRLAEAATPGEWHVHRQHGLRGIFSEQCKVAACMPWPKRDCVKTQEANEDYIAAASPSKVLALLDEIAALRRVAEAAKELTFCCEGLEDTREDWARYQDALHDTSAALTALDSKEQHD